MSNRHEAWNFWKQDDIKREFCVRTPRDLQFACSCTWLHSAHALTHKPNDGIIGTRTVSTAVCELVCACALPDSRHTSGAASGTLMSLFPSSGSMQKCFGVDREATSIPMVTWHLDWQSYLPLHAMHADGALFRPHKIWRSLPYDDVDVTKTTLSSPIWWRGRCHTTQRRQSALRTKPRMCCRCRPLVIRLSCLLFPKPGISGMFLSEN